jgi:hypothetical protein
VALEVPWREGTSVRSATHEDLIRVLSPLQRLPKVDLVQASLTIDPRGGQTPTGGELTGELKISFVPWYSTVSFV